MQFTIPLSMHKLFAQTIEAIVQTVAQSCMSAQQLIDKLRNNLN